MPSLFDREERAAIARRFQTVRTDSPASWGKMNSAQMMVHCQQSLHLALGDLRLKRVLIGILFGRLAKKSLSSPKPFGHGLPTAREFIVKDTRDFTREQRQLLELLEHFGAVGRSGLTKDPHPFFGPMRPEEWDMLQWKHFDHHLRQFGA